MTQVVMGMIVKNRFSELKRNLYHNSQFFDRVIVVSDSSEPEVNDWLTSDEAKRLKIEAVLDFDGYQTIRLRNRYLAAAEKTGWMMRLDVDEFLSLEGGHNLREIIRQAEGAGINIVEFKACDIVAQLDGSTRIANPDFWCPNLFKLTPQITYQGLHHEGINLGVPHQHARVDFKYYHIRSEASVHLRGTRNGFAVAQPAGGPGDEAAWRALRSRCAEAGITAFYQLESLMRAGAVPPSLTEWFIEQRNSVNSEFRSFFVTYFVLLHPELNQGFTNQEFPTFDPDRKPYPGEMSF